MSQAQLPLRGSLAQKKDETKIRACIGPLYGTINWNAVAGWIKYHEERWGLSHVDIVVRKNEFATAKEDLESVQLQLQSRMNFTSLSSVEQEDLYNKDQYWLIQECLMNAKENKDDFLINFDADEFLTSDDFSTLDEMFEFADRPGVSFPMFQNNYHRCSKNEPTFDSATYQPLVPYGSEKATDGYTDPPTGANGHRKYIVIPEHFATLKGVHDPGDYGGQREEDVMFHMTGRKVDHHHARILHYRTGCGIHADKSEHLCTVVEACKYLSIDGHCVEDASLAYFENDHSAVDKILTNLPLTPQAGALFGEAVCYAERYVNLFDEFCHNETDKCRYTSLQEHYRNPGKPSKMIWGCNERTTSSARPAAHHHSPSEKLHLLYKHYQEPLELHILLFETTEKEDFMLVLQQSSLVGINTTVIGSDTIFDGYASKWASAYTALQALPSNALAVVVDSRDTLLNVHAFGEHKSRHVIDNFIRAYRALTLKNPNAVVFGAEGQCCVSVLTHAQPGDYFDASTGGRRKRACFSGENGCLWMGETLRVPWEAFQEDLAKDRTGAHLTDVYLNAGELTRSRLACCFVFFNRFNFSLTTAGLVVARPSDLIRLIEAADMDATEDDQAVFTDLMYYHPESIVLDYAQEMFGNSRWTTGMANGGCPFDIAEDGGHLVHQETMTSPLFLHFPGKFWECAEALANKLGIDASKAINRQEDRRLNYHPECTTVTVDFQTSAEGFPLFPAVYVEKEWELYGLVLSSTGGFGTKPRLFDTANPGTKRYGDPDLGAPNKHCPYPGPGLGEGGEQGAPGENCSPLGNVLIIQEVNDNMDIPDDNADGGTITFDFTGREAEYVYEIGLLDVDYNTNLEIVHGEGNGYKLTTISVPLLGDNSHQVISIDARNVKKIVLTAEKSVAVSFIKFCYTPPPDKCAGVICDQCNECDPEDGYCKPVADTTPCDDGSVCTVDDACISGLCFGGADICDICTDYRRDFGNIPAGTYIGSQYQDPYGLLLSSTGGLGDIPRLFDTANPGTVKYGDLDLGAPNESCPYPGPRWGEGGKKGAPGENGEPLGNVLIIQEDNEYPDIPDDNVDGGTITFDFSGNEAKFVAKMGLLDVDYKTTIKVVYKYGDTYKRKLIHVPELGDNSYQEVDIHESNVKKIILTLERSGAVVFLGFCYRPPIYL